MEYLVSHAQQFHAPTDDFADEEQSEESQKERETAISNLSQGSPPVIPSTIKPYPSARKPSMPSVSPIQGTSPEAGVALN